MKKIITAAILAMALLITTTPAHSFNWRAGAQSALEGIGNNMDRIAAERRAEARNFQQQYGYPQEWANAYNNMMPNTYYDITNMGGGFIRFLNSNGCKTWQQSRKWFGQCD